MVKIRNTFCFILLGSVLLNNFLISTKFQNPKNGDLRSEIAQLQNYSISNVEIEKLYQFFQEESQSEFQRVHWNTKTNEK